MPKSRYRAHPRTHITRAQGPLQAPQTPPYNPQQQSQLPPQQIGPWPQHVNRVLHQPSYYTPPLTVHHPNWPSNQHIRQNNHNSLFYHPPVAGPNPPVLQQALQLPAYTTSGGFGQHLHDSPDGCSEYRYAQYEGMSTDVQAYHETSPFGILWNPQVPTVENDDEAHNLDDSEPPINAANPQIRNGSMDPNEFHTLPGYRGRKNQYGLFECFDDCKHNRLEEQGFPRRANLLAHLRSCHGQNIPRGARVNLY